MRTSFRNGLTLLALVASVLLAGCKGKDTGQSGEIQEQEQLAKSIYAQPGDSLRWVEYLRKDPSDTARAYIMMAALYLTNHHPRPAVDYLYRAMKYNPDRPNLYLNLGYAYNELGRAAMLDSTRMAMFDSASTSFNWYVQRAPQGMVTKEVYRIVEKYRSIKSESEIPR
ncbi:MAG: hypothetical protein U9P14_02425 [Gemmatimonadota bacterium]|nr:hypothetical protein [Gemmatimonadota bacterium]